VASSNQTRNLIVAIALCAVSFGTYAIHARRPYSEPEATIRAFFESANRGDLTGVQAAASGSLFGEFVRHFGEPRYRRVVQAYDRVARLGRGHWQEIRRRAENSAGTAFGQLRERVSSLGAEALRRLPSDEGFRLIQDPPAREAFRWKAGFDALSAEDRQRAGSVDELREGSGFARFVEREAWASLSDADRAELGAPAAISTQDTPEKLAFLDRIGLTIVDEETKKEIGEIKRSELGDQDAFKFKYGSPLAEEYLKRGTIPKDVSVVRCVYPAEELHGSLFRETTAQCEASAVTPRGPVRLGLALQKLDRKWLLSGISPMPYDVW
jgi:hypothetical protein